MIGYKYINEPLPHNKEMANEIGIDYANDGKSIRYDPVRVEKDSWTIDYQRVHKPCNNPQEWDCQRCSENDGYDEETIVIRVKRNKHTYMFTRTRGHQIGSTWSNWYDESYSITPAK